MFLYLFILYRLNLDESAWKHIAVDSIGGGRFLFYEGIGHAACLCQ